MLEGTPCATANPPASHQEKMTNCPRFVEAMAKIERLGTAELYEAVKPLMTAKQTKRVAALNRKAQDEGLSDAEENERNELLHVYDKPVLVRSAALAELHKRGVNVNELIAP